MASETTVGTISVDIVARMDKLESNLKKAGSSFAAMGGVIAGATTALTNFAVNAASQAVSKLADLTAQAFKTIDAQAKLAESFDANINGLRGITYAGDLAGASAEEVGNAFGFMTKFLGDALNGEQKNIEAIDKLGLSLFDLTKVESDQAFLDIAEAIAKIPTAGQRAAAAMDVFGKAGKKLLPLIMSDIKGAQEEFQKMGGFLKDGDAKGIENANDAVTKLVTQLSILVDTLAVRIAPAIEKAANILTAKFGDVGGAVVGLIDHAHELAEVTMGGFLKPFSFAIGDRTTAADQDEANNKLMKEAALASDLATKQANREQAAADAYWASQDAAIKKNYDTMMKEATKALNEETAAQLEWEASQIKKGMKEKPMTTRALGFAGELQAGGVSAQAQRQAAKQVQVVTDPALQVTNKILSDVNSSIKKMGMGTAVTV